MNADSIEIEYLPDGTVKSSNGTISQANHSSADGFFKVLAQLLGGEVTRTKRAHGVHVHHQHEHAREGQ